MNNFAPNLTEMFRSAGINDVQSYVDEVRDETRDLDHRTLTSSTSTSKKHHGKMIMTNAKQIYQFVRKCFLGIERENVN